MHKESTHDFIFDPIIAKQSGSLGLLFLFDSLSNVFFERINHIRLELLGSHVVCISHSNKQPVLRLPNIRNGDLGCLLLGPPQQLDGLG